MMCLPSDSSGFEEPERCYRASPFAMSSVYLLTLAVQQLFAPVNNCSAHPPASTECGCEQGDEGGKSCVGLVGLNNYEGSYRQYLVISNSPHLNKEGLINLHFPRKSKFVVVTLQRMSAVARLKSSISPNTGTARERRRWNPP
jgi:hypothetical protein